MYHSEGEGLADRGEANEDALDKQIADHGDG